MPPLRRQLITLHEIVDAMAWESDRRRAAGNNGADPSVQGDGCK
jgi:hypothetical protein